MINFMRTDSGITAIFDGVPVHIASTHADFDKVLQAIRDGKTADEIKAVFEKASQILKKVSKLSDNISLEGGLIYYRGEVLKSDVADAILQYMDNSLPSQHLVLFLENLMKNPSYRVVEQLYSFLEYGKNPITEDGCFLAFKAIRKDWTDIHSGRFSNTIGTVVQMPRNQVDENPNQTCSKGLHVCSYDYLPHFAHADGRVVVCKVNPADVVAIPTDYNNTKMRCCKYEVVAEFNGYYTEAVSCYSKPDASAEELTCGIKLYLNEEAVDFSTPTLYKENAQIVYFTELAAVEKMTKLVNEGKCVRAEVFNKENKTDILYSCQ